MIFYYHKFNTSFMILHIYHEIGVTDFIIITFQDYYCFIISLPSQYSLSDNCSFISFIFESLLLSITQFVTIYFSYFVLIIINF